MKKSLEAELMSLAHRVLQLRGRADVDELKSAAAELHEKLAVLAFTEKHFAGPRPTIGKKQVEEALDEGNAASAEKESKTAPENRSAKENFVPSHNEDPEITEEKTQPEEHSNSEKQPQPEEKDPAKPGQGPTQKTSQKPSEKQSTSENLHDMAVHYDDLPQFEPVKQRETPSQNTAKGSNELEKPAGRPTENDDQPAKSPEHNPQKLENDLPSPSREKQTKNDLNAHKKSLNDQLNHGLNFGLNDRLAFIKHLFEGNATDFERVISQLNTVQNFSEAKRFIEENVKPDYNWENEEVYEKRFLNSLEKRMG